MMQITQYIGGRFHYQSAASGNFSTFSVSADRTRQYIYCRLYRMLRILQIIQDHTDLADHTGPCRSCRLYSTLQILQIIQDVTDIVDNTAKYISGRSYKSIQILPIIQDHTYIVDHTDPTGPYRYRSCRTIRSVSSNNSHRS